jgi:hypothetical protein
MDSAFSILASLTMPFTSRLIGQLVVHFIQSPHWLASAFSRKAGQPNKLRSLRLKIMNGAIQQIVWQPARLPAKMKSQKNTHDSKIDDIGENDGTLEIHAIEGG